MNKKRETIAGWLFLAPALIIFAILVVFPVIMSLCLSFTEWNFLSGLEGIKWKGLANFERLFTRDRKFMMALGNTVFYASRPRRSPSSSACCSPSCSTTRCT